VNISSIRNHRIIYCEISYDLMPHTHWTWVIGVNKTQAICIEWHENSISFWHGSHSHSYANVTGQSDTALSPNAKKFVPLAVLIQLWKSIHLSLSLSRKIFSKRRNKRFRFPLKLILCCFCSFLWLSFSHYLWIVKLTIN